MTFVFILIMILIFGGIIAYSVFILYLQHKAKNMKRRLWDDKGYNTTKQLSTLYIDEGRKHNISFVLLKL